MRLVVATPTSIVVDVPDVRNVRAEDASGAFGLRPGHAPFVTALVASVVCYRDASDVERFVAVRGGVLRVHDADVEVATGEALAGDELDALRRAVVERYRAEALAEATARARAVRLHALAMRAIYRHVRGDEGGDA